jgi:hypothetical protein
MEKIRRLYENDARGIVDEQLLDDVGTTLYCRCESILDASDAAIGKVHCPSCGNVIARRSVPKAISIEAREKVVCKKCGWEVEWIAYQKTYQHKDLWGLSFAGTMHEFMARWTKAPKARDKMLLIDRLIHIWHHEFSNERAPTRCAAPTFIEGGRRQVVSFLDELSGLRRSS